MIAWMADLNAKERRTMGACFGGWALDAFDVQMYSFIIPTVIALWGLSRGEAGLIGTVTLLISSLGGWFCGTLSDRFGRVRMLQLTILWYSVFTFLCAFAQDFQQLFIAARAARTGLRRRMGGRRGADGRGDPRQVSRPRRRPGADRMGGRVGRLGAGLHRALRVSCPRPSHGACCSRSACCPRCSYSGSADISKSPRSSTPRAVAAPRSASRICSRPSARRICGPR